LYRRLVGPQDRSGLAWKISPSLGFDPRIVQPTGIRYTNYAIPAAMGQYREFIIYNLFKDTFSGSDYIASNVRKISE
jgi:hypothetical protein